MSNVLMFNTNLENAYDNQIKTLPVIPKDMLLKKYIDYRKNIETNYSNIDYLLFGEALIEEIETRKHTREFEEILAGKEIWPININY
jgi:hypothetical protein